EFRQSLEVIVGPAIGDDCVVAFHVAMVLEAEAKSAQAIHKCCGGSAVKKPDHRHRELLRARSQRPRRRAPERRDELAPFHSITSSAMASTPGGMVRPRALAVLRLITNSILVGACTGRMPGLAPLRMRSTYAAAWR